MSNTQKNRHSEQTIIRKCHCCGQIIESKTESHKCLKCGKAFLPLNYFHKIHAEEKNKFNELFADSSQLYEEDLIKGLFVLW